MGNEVVRGAGRYAWVDVLKFLGIYAIYVGHFGERAGAAESFVYVFHVPLFFLVSGFFATRGRGLTFTGFLVKKATTVAIPYLLFCVIFLAFYVVLTRSVPGVGDVVVPLFLGIRNQTPAAALWFLPCLLVIMIVWELAYRATRNAYAVLAVAVALWAVAEFVLPSRPVVDPSWVLNADSAMYYMIYYAIGAVAFPFLRDFTRLDRGLPTLIAHGTLLVVSIPVAVYLILGLDPFVDEAGPRDSVLRVVLALLMIHLCVGVAHALSRFSFLARMGRQTLFYCGNEEVVKLLLAQVLALVGISTRDFSPPVVLVYALFLLVASYFTIVPIEAKAFSRLTGHRFWDERRMLGGQRVIASLIVPKPRHYRREHKAEVVETRGPRGGTSTPPTRVEASHVAGPGEGADPGR